MSRSIFLKMRLYSKLVLINDIVVVVRKFFTLHFSNISLSRSMLGLYLSSFFAAASLHLMNPSMIAIAILISKYLELGLKLLLDLL